MKKLITAIVIFSSLFVKAQVYEVYGVFVVRPVYHSYSSSYSSYSKYDYERDEAKRKESEKRREEFAKYGKYYKKCVFSNFKIIEESLPIIEEAESNMKKIKEDIIDYVITIENPICISVIKDDFRKRRAAFSYALSIVEENEDVSNMYKEYKMYEQTIVQYKKTIENAHLEIANTRKKYYALKSRWEDNIPDRILCSCKNPNEDIEDKVNQEFAYRKITLKTYFY